MLPHVIEAAEVAITRRDEMRRSTLRLNDKLWSSNMMPADKRMKIEIYPIYSLFLLFSGIEKTPGKIKGMSKIETPSLDFVNSVLCCRRDGSVSPRRVHPNTRLLLSRL
eukprot:scaffold626278_cov45-Prasinocladus_malaysianus.AAC.2